MKLFERLSTFFAQFGNGSGISSTLLLVNPSRDRTATGTVKLFDRNGNLLSVPINGVIQKGSFNFSVPAMGAGFYATDGAGNLTSGSVQLEPLIRIDGTVLFAGGFGVAGVGTVQPKARFFVPVESETARGVNTGLALSNPSTSPADLVVHLRDANGVLKASASLSLPSNGQLARFPDEIFQGQQVDLSRFTGTLEVDSRVPLAGMAIRVSPGEFATLPVAPADQGYSNLYFAQFGDGQGISSTLLLINPSPDQSAVGRVRLFDADGNPLSVDINGAVQKGTFRLQVPPRGIGLYKTDGLGELVAGSVCIDSLNVPVAGTVLFSGGFGVAGLGSAQPRARFLIPIESYAGRGIRTGVALFNPGTNKVDLVLRLRDVDGKTLSNGILPISLGAKAQLARFAEELFQTRGINFSSFRGTLEVDSPVPVVGMAIRSSPGQLATLPVTEMN